MALKECPNCGMQISDQAEKCVHCGYDLKNKQLIKCRECGAAFDPERPICPNCGCPSQELEVEDCKKKGKKKKVIIPIILILVVVAIGIGINVYNQEKNAEEYYNTVEDVGEAMDESSNEIDESQQLLLAVWNNAIWEENDPLTDPYVYPNGVQVKDFNEALSNLYSDEEFISDIEIINNSQKKLRKLKVKLENPPKEMKEKNEVILKSVDKYIEISMLVLDPSGNYYEVFQKFNDLYSDLNECFLQIEVFSEE